MKPSIIISTEEYAGLNIKEALQGLHNFCETTEMFHGFPVLSKEGVKIYTTDKRSIYCDNIDEEVEGDYIIFPTTHRSAAGTKSFSVHAPGNWDKAELGGKEKKLCCAMPDYMKEALNKIKNMYQGDEFELIQECTHHGPALTKPCMFIEIGSSETEWKRRDAGEIIANAVNYIAINPPKKHKSVIVLGGGHYNQVATKLMLNTEYSVGHICPKHMLPKLDEKMLKQAIEKNGERFEMVVLDWKGMSTEKQRITEMLDKMEVKHEKWQKMNREESSEE